MNPPKFSGKCRDNSVFKRDFLSFVEVGHRSNIVKGAILKESIPANWRYLLDKFDLFQYDQMMEALTCKFGRARVIVDNCTSEIRRMKVSSNDQEFISFMNQLDKLKRDLDQLGLTADIVNTTVISDLESKLPWYVQRDSASLDPDTSI